MATKEQTWMDAFGALSPEQQRRVASEVGLWFPSDTAATEKEFRRLILLRACNWGRVKQLSKALKREAA